MASSNNPPLLFLHGFRGNGLGLSSLADYLPDYDCHFPQLPPAGGHTLAEFDANHYAKYVADYIKYHQLDHPVLVAHSMGSIVAAATAAKYPELINTKLILMSPLSVKPAKIFARLTPLSAILPNKAVGYVTTKFLLGKKGKKKLKSILATTYLCGADYTTKRDVYRSAQFSVRHSIDDFKFKQTTLLLAGEQDRLIKRTATKELAQKIGAKTVFLKDTGHLHNYEAPKSTAKAIQAFLEDN